MIFKRFLYFINILTLGCIIVTTPALATPNYGDLSDGDTENIAEQLNTENAVDANAYITAYNNYSDMLSQVEAEINDLSTQINDTNNQIIQIEEKLKNNQSIIGNLIKWQYKYTKNPFIELVLGGWEDFISTLEYNNAINTQYAHVIEESNSLLQEKNNDLADLQDKQDKETALKEQLELNSNKIQSLIPDVPVGTYDTVIDAALSRLGCPYVWGATGNSSFDCSGLCIWCINQVYGSSFASKFGRTTWDFDASMQHVALKDLKPGDLVFKNISETSQHVGIYLGRQNGIDYCIHAPSPGQVVRIQKMSECGWQYGLRYSQ